MNGTGQLKTTAKMWMPILALSLILLPGAAMAEAGTGSGVSAEPGPASGLAGFFRPLAEWLRAVTGLDNQVNEGGTGEPQSSAGGGTGISGKTGQRNEKSAGNGTG